MSCPTCDNPEVVLKSEVRHASTSIPPTVKRDLDDLRKLRVAAASILSYDHDNPMGDNPALVEVPVDLLVDLASCIDPDLSPTVLRRILQNEEAAEHSRF